MKRLWLQFEDWLFDSLGGKPLSTAVLRRTEYVGVGGYKPYAAVTSGSRSTTA